MIHIALCRSGCAVPMNACPKHDTEANRKRFKDRFPNQHVHFDHENKSKSCEDFIANDHCPDCGVRYVRTTSVPLPTDNVVSENGDGIDRCIEYWIHNDCKGVK